MRDRKLNLVYFSGGKTTHLCRWFHEMYKEKGWVWLQQAGLNDRLGGWSWN